MIRFAGAVGVFCSWWAFGGIASARDFWRGLPLGLGFPCFIVLALSCVVLFLVSVVALFGGAEAFDDTAQAGEARSDETTKIGSARRASTRSRRDAPR